MILLTIKLLGKINIKTLVFQLFFAIQIKKIRNVLQEKIYSNVSAFLQKSTGDNRIPFYFGSCILLISAVLLLLPFPKHKADDIKEIKIEVDDDY